MLVQALILSNALTPTLSQSTAFTEAVADANDEFFTVAYATEGASRYSDSGTNSIHFKNDIQSLCEVQSKFDSSLKLIATNSAISSSFLTTKGQAVLKRTLQTYSDNSSTISSMTGVCAKFKLDGSYHSFTGTFLNKYLGSLNSLGSLLDSLKEEDNYLP